MPRFAKHLLNRTIHNPFPGIVKLEQALGHPVTLRIGSNESLPEPPSPLETLFGATLAEQARLYPDPYALALRQRAARLNDVRPEQVLFDSGADSLLLLALRLACNVGDTVVTTAGSYPTVRYFAEGVGARVEEVAYADHGQQLRTDLAALAASAHQSHAAVLYLSNPDNPSGHYWRAADILALRAALPADTLLLLDEAYIDFCTAPADAAPHGVLANTIRLRTLSKAYGLAGLRVGYAIAPADIIAKADQIRPQYALSSLAQLAARTVLDDAHYSRRLIDQTLTLRDKLAEALQRRGLQVLPSHTNFVAVRYPDAAAAQTRQQTLLQAGIAVHRPTHPAVASLLRITAHPRALQDDVLTALSAG